MPSTKEGIGAIMQTQESGWMRKKDGLSEMKKLWNYA
jgi:hypothetical protein